MNDTQQESMTTNPRDNIGQMNRKVNNGQKNIVNGVPLTYNRNIESLIRKVMLAPEPDMEE